MLKNMKAVMESRSIFGSRLKRKTYETSLIPILTKSKMVSTQTDLMLLIRQRTDLLKPLTNP